MKRSFLAAKVPEGIEVCEKQLMHLVKRVHDVEVNEKEIAPYLDAIYNELNDLEKDELIRRFVSIEFNRFLEYYRKAPDLNVDAHSSRNSSDPNAGYRASGPRMFVSIGAKDGLDKGKLLRFLCDETGERGTSFGRIDVKGVYSFVDVLDDKLESVMKKIHGIEYAGRVIRTEVSTDSPSSGGGRSRGGSSRGDGGSRGGERRGGGGYSGGGDRERRSYGGGRDSGRSSSGGGRGFSGGGGRDRDKSRGGDFGKRDDSRSNDFAKRDDSRSDFGRRDDSRSSSGGDSEKKSRKEKFSKW